jgi:cyclopropane fatty-acyl-phospholipid synthase-like methyltransferase
MRLPPPPVTAAAEPTLWPTCRLAVAEALWGEGFLFPGGEAETLQLANPLGLSAAASLMVIGAGGGGPPRSIARQFGSWVSGFESDPQLVAVAAKHCAHSGLGRRVSVARWDPEAPVFRARHYHHGFALEPLRVTQAEAGLAAIAHALKPSGQLLLVETVADRPMELDNPEVAAWMRLDGRTRPPPAEIAVTQVLGRLGFDVRVTEDISARHAAQALQGWRSVVAALRDHPPDARHAVPLVAEAELWLLRLRLIRDGKLRLVRWHALGQAER